MNGRWTGDCTGCLRGSRYAICARPFRFDYSERCRHATPFVESLIEKTGASLTMLNVIETPIVDYTSGDAFAVPQAVREEVLACGAGFLREYAREAFRCYAVDTVCRMGDPAKENILRRVNMRILLLRCLRGLGAAFPRWRPLRPFTLRLGLN